jgi:hypothetical protein
MGLYIVIALLIAIIIVQEIIHKQERKDLYNRIMARDLPEYKADGKTRTVPNLLKRNLEKNKDKLLKSIE